MIEAKILYGFLDKLAKETQRELEEDGSLTKQNVIPFLMREQFEKISRIEDEFATSQDLYGLVILGFTVLGYLIRS